MLLDLLNHRRAVRHFDADKPLDSITVRHCLEQAQLAPSSSNLQLYEFYHITGKATLEALATACLSQQAAPARWKGWTALVLRKSLACRVARKST